MSETTRTLDQASDKSLFGFWVYIMTDCILFATLFASYAVLHNNTFGKEGAGELFSLPYILVETLILLTGSFTVGLGLLSARHGEKKSALLWFGVAFLLGTLFLGMELYEFNHLIIDGNSWRESGFLSAYFALVGTHGLHITAGLIWMAVLLLQIFKQGINVHKLRKLTMLSMFWHFLDIIWIFIFSFVYLLGGVK